MSRVDLLVPARSRPAPYRVSFEADRWTCECPGFQNRGCCRHVSDTQSLAFEALRSDVEIPDNVRELLRRMAVA